MSNAIVVADSRAIERYLTYLGMQSPQVGAAAPAARSTRSMSAPATKPASRLCLWVPRPRVRSCVLCVVLLLMFTHPHSILG